MSVFDRIGGQPGVDAIVDDLYARVLADPVTAPKFDGVDMTRQHAHLKWFLAAATGGPEPFTGPSMTDAHRGLGITDAQFDAVAAHLVAAARANGVDDATIGEMGESVQPLRPHIVGV